MKIYICTSGTYSEYSIDAVFLTLEKANLYAFVHDGQVEEFETEDDNICASDVYYRYHIIYNPGTDDEFKCHRVGTTVDFKDESQFSYYLGTYHYVFVSKRDYTEEELKKIFFDKLAEEKAKGLGIV